MPNEPPSKSPLGGTEGAPPPYTLRPAPRTYANAPAAPNPPIIASLRTHPGRSGRTGPMNGNQNGNNSSSERTSLLIWISPLDDEPRDRQRIPRRSQLTSNEKPRNCRPGNLIMPFALLLLMSGCLFSVFQAFRNGWEEHKDDAQLPDWSGVEQRERLLYRNLGMVWEIPVQSKHCTAYNSRTYTARLWSIPTGFNWDKACKYMQITIHNQTFEEPALCDNRGFWGGMNGQWNVEDVTCRPYWGHFRDVGCTGSGSGSRRVESRLWGLRKGEDWFSMCETSPATLFNVHYGEPTCCENRGFFNGMWGIWDVEDAVCMSLADENANSIANSAASDTQPPETIEADVLEDTDNQVIVS